MVAPQSNRRLCRESRTSNIRKSALLAIALGQHGACITKTSVTDGTVMGRLTSKIHALVDSNGLPVRLALSLGEVHDKRLGGKHLWR